MIVRITIAYCAPGGDGFAFAALSSFEGAASGAFETAESVATRYGNFRSEWPKLCVCELFARRSEAALQRRYRRAARRVCIASYWVWVRVRLSTESATTGSLPVARAMSLRASPITIVESRSFSHGLR